MDLEVFLWGVMIFIFLLLLFSRPYRQWKEHKYSEFLKKVKKGKKRGSSETSEEKEVKTGENTVEKEG